MRTPIRTAARLLVPAALLAAAGQAHAQDTLSVRPGARVRVTAPVLGIEREVGTVQGVRGDTLVFRGRGGGEPLPVLIPRVARLEVPRGSISPVRGFLIGGGAGLLVGYGAAAALAASDECTASDCFTGRT
ncbi:MAG TPA: hypothetical protein VGR37_03915, partial [Longimicrobiaceae bacterium]|nr:hypothetical protein [Longimicrobiaceae bacterium]